MNFVVEFPTVAKDSFELANSLAELLNNCIGDGRIITVMPVAKVELEEAAKAPWTKQLFIEE